MGVENMNKKVDQAVSSLEAGRQRVPPRGNQQPDPNQPARPFDPWCPSGNLGHVNPAAVGVASWQSSQSQWWGYPGGWGTNNDVRTKYHHELHEKNMQLQAYERTIWEMRGSFQELVGRNNHLAQSGFRMDHRIRQLEADLKQSKDQLEWKDNVLQKTRQTLEKLQNSKLNNEDKACSTDEDLPDGRKTKEAMEKVEHLSKELDEKNMQLKEKDRVVLEMQDMFQDLVKESNHLKDENKALKRDVEGIDSEFQTQINLLEDEVRRISDQKAEVQCQLNEEKDSKKNQEAENEELKQKLFANVGRSEMLEDEIQVLRSENKKLSDLCDQMSMKP